MGYSDARVCFQGSTQSGVLVFCFIGLVGVGDCFRVISLVVFTLALIYYIAKDDVELHNHPVSAF